MISQEYSIAISETLEILNHTKKEDINKIHSKFLEFLQNNASKEYTPALDFSKSLKEMNLSPKTIGILSIINKRYWCNDTERKEFEEKLKQNEMKYQRELNEKYDTNKLFKGKELNKASNTNITDLTEYIEQKWYQKLFEKISKIFRTIRK